MSAKCVKSLWKCKGCDFINDATVVHCIACFNNKDSTSTLNTPLDTIGAVISTEPSQYQLCSDGLLTCQHLHRLTNVMQQYRRNKYSSHFIDHINQYLEDFLHLIHYHPTNTEFEAIYAKFGGKCNLRKCRSFKRHNSNRQKLHHMHSFDVHTQILDKIHCYYTHSFDIGMRLSHKERYCFNQVADDENEEKHNQFFSQQVLEMKNILSNKCKSYRSARSTKYMTNTMQNDSTS
eukprot:735708_1